MRKKIVGILVFLSLCSAFASSEEHHYAVVNFTSDHLERSVLEQMQQDLSYYLVEHGAKVVERNRLEYFIKQQEQELRLEEIGLTDQDKILELGRIASPDRFVFGSIRKNTYDENYTLEVTVVNAQTAVKVDAKRLISDEPSDFFGNALDSLALRLTNPSGKVVINSQAGGKLYIDGRLSGKISSASSMQRYVKTGQHTFSIRYTDSSGEVIHSEQTRRTVQKDGTVKIRFQWQPPSGSLVVSTQTPGTLYIGGTKKTRLGAGSSSTVSLPVGSYSVKIVYGAHSERRWIQIEEDQRQHISFTWKPLRIPAQKISAGAFTMGEEGRINRPERQVRISSTFSMSKYEVYNSQTSRILNWALAHNKIVITSGKVYNAEGARKLLLDLGEDDLDITFSGGSFRPQNGRERYPTVEITWYGAAALCNYLSEMKGLTPTYSLSDWSCNWNNSGYRLPTEAEWEYAAAGGSGGGNYPYSGSDAPTRVAWYSKNSGRKLHPVGQLKPNRLGLHDMSGNASEWCWDWYEREPEYDNAVDPRGPGRNTYRVRKGGAWRSRERSIEVSARSYMRPEQSSKYVGFRMLRVE